MYNNVCDLVRFAVKDINVMNVKKESPVSVEVCAFRFPNLVARCGFSVLFSTYEYEFFQKRRHHVHL